MNDLSLHIIDIIQNSVRAGAGRIWLSISEMPSEDLLKITIEDNGKGMSADEIEKLDDPFFTSRTTRKIGMGIPLFKQTAGQAGGGLEVESAPGKGTRVTASFRLSHIDLPPMGDVANAFALMAGANPGIDFEFKYSVGAEEYSLDTADVKEALPGIPLGAPETVKMLAGMIRNNIDALKEREHMS